MYSMNKVFSSMFKKLKSIKHIEVILAVLLGLIVLLVYFSSTSSGSGVKTVVSTSNSQVSQYTAEVESRLEALLEDISGAGDVSVMVMCKPNTELKSEVVPTISSVVVVASGATSAAVKLDIIKAVEALLSLDPGNIEVLS